MDRFKVLDRGKRFCVIDTNTNKPVAIETDEWEYLFDKKYQAERFLEIVQDFIDDGSLADYESEKEYL